MTGATRWIELDGAHNVRDLGGLPAAGGRTRPGMLLRSDALDALTDDDVRVLVEQVGLVHVVDLRSDDERFERGRGRLGGTGVTYSELTIVDEEMLARRREQRAEALARGQDPIDIMADGYVQFLELGGAVFADAVRRVAGPGGTPALVHCAVGKDRTGVLIALLLEVAGVERDVVVADYAATDERMDRVLGRLAGAERFERLAASIPAFALQAQAETMQRFLDQLDARWGGAERFLVDHGIEDEVLAAWRDRFVAAGS